MEAIATKHNLPRELIAYIHDFNNMKPQYNEVLNELVLKYNMGLWWLSTPPKYIFNKREMALADPWDEHLWRSIWGYHHLMPVIYSYIEVIMLV